MTRPFRPRDRIRSFHFAGRGIWLMLATQHNAWLHAVATAGVGIAGLAAGLNRMEWCCLVLAASGVWTAEAMNTALEFLCDVASPEFHPLVERAKDVAAGAVLIAAAAAIVIGALVFWPHVPGVGGMPPQANTTIY